MKLLSIQLVLARRLMVACLMFAISAQASPRLPQDDKVISAVADLLVKTNGVQNRSVIEAYQRGFTRGIEIRNSNLLNFTLSEPYVEQAIRHLKSGNRDFDLNLAESFVRGLKFAMR
jgi:hypothetical protein